MTVDAGRALRHAAPVPYWLDQPHLRPDPLARLSGDDSCDLAIVGGGYTGLWAALLAKEEDPSRDVALLEAGECGGAASGRNGGFCAASLTHGFGNGMARWPHEMPTLLRMGRENLDAIEETLRRHHIDCDFQRTGELDVATAEWQVPELKEWVEQAQQLGEEVRWLDAEEVRAQVHSPIYRGAVFDPDVALVDPARLAWGLRAACERLGVRIHEHTEVTALHRDGTAEVLTTGYGSMRARRVALATNAFRPLLRRLRLHVVPVYDYALVTEPLGDRLAEVGWAHRQGIGDAGNQFHYYRLTEDNRIVWGGYDAIYHYGNGMRLEHEQRPETFALLARHFAQTFPQLSDVGFSHAWGGVIDTSTRFSAFWGTAHEGRVGYALGYTGLGVGASRFGARVMLDLIDGRDTERTRLSMVRSRPTPFPPEPIRYGAVQLTRWSMDHADRSQGRRNLWLRTLDRLGLGFDS
ncbi:FAD-dependent oxidoreductase [Janibacter cremeus]|uniref:NAD(P)/FAD-dependent oxidoreductase n=1 Tax=Janibacter cremeus TaxID=1285192 RepID=UPI0023F6299F|nr:FAD-dependent oxidoreductase [Janibacter cremeus]WEV78873.1 FAD-dependent oxidoreductase [Janibacter cremeus]